MPSRFAKQNVRRKRGPKCPKCGLWSTPYKGMKCQDCHNAYVSNWYAKDARKRQVDYEKVFELFAKYD